MAKPERTRPLEVAIIGGGIVGATLGLGLLRRNISFTIYERASHFREIGAGISFNPTAVRAMRRLNPVILEGFEKVVTRIDSVEPYVFYIDGFTQPEHDANDEDDAAPVRDAAVFTRHLGEAGAEGCRRSDFLEEVVRFLPSRHVRFNKNLVEVDETGDDGRAHLTFKDGSSADADVVIGCDGINSRLRKLMFGEDNPASYPGYSHRFCFRGVIPIDSVYAVLGDRYRRAARTLYTGPDAHLIMYPVAGGKMLNVAAFVYDPKPWTSPKMTVPATREEAIEAFTDFGPAVRAIVSLLPERLEKWGIFDLLEHPLPGYSKGVVCLAGDAAHASSPHHGAGAGFGIEDALLLSELLAVVQGETGTDRTSLHHKVEAALSVYNETRYERTQWLIKSSRRNGDLSEWRYKGVRSDHKRFQVEEKWRMDKIRHYDTDLMVKGGLELLRDRLQE